MTIEEIRAVLIDIYHDCDVKERIGALIESIDLDQSKPHQPLMTEEEIRQYRPHPGPIGGIGSPPKQENR
jgi:hypothetical protein